MNLGLKTFDDLMTADEFFNSPFVRTHELVAGRLVPLSGKGILKLPTGFQHGTIAALLTEELRRFVRKNKLGAVVAAETGFRLFENPDTIRDADVAFVIKEKLEKHGVTKGFFPEAPDLAVEVVSPGNSKADIQEKVKEYLTAGTGLI